MRATPGGEGWKKMKIGGEKEKRTNLSFVGKGRGGKVCSHPLRGEKTRLREEKKKCP